MLRIVGVINCNHGFFFHSVDYDAPLSEAGDITEKFQALKEVIEKYNPDADKQGDKTCMMYVCTGLRKRKHVLCVIQT